MKICLAGTIAGIVFLYFAVTNLYVSHYRIGDITTAHIGTLVNISGNITDIYIHKNGHIFFTLEDETGRIKVVLWSSVVDGMKRNGVNVSKIKPGTKAQLTGNVKLYRGELEVVPRLPRDVVIY